MMTYQATTSELRSLVRVAAARYERRPDDGWAGDFAEQVPSLLDELDAARVALVEALGSEGAVPPGGLAAGIRKLAEQRDRFSQERDALADAETCAADPGPRRWDTGEPLTFGSAGD